MATMEEKRPAAADVRESPPENLRVERRRKAHEVLALQRVQLDRLEGDLSEQLRELAEEITRHLAEGYADQAAAMQAEADQDGGSDLHPQIEELTRLLAARQSELEQARLGREQAQVEQARLEQELRLHEALLRDLQAQQELRRSDSVAKDEQLSDAQAQLALARQRQDELRRELETQRERGAAAVESTKDQRRRLAREFKDRRARELAEIAQQRAQLESLQAACLAEGNGAAEMAEVRASENRLSATLQQRGAELAEVRQQLETLTRETSGLRASLAAAQSLAGSDHPAANPQEVKQLKEERDNLAKRLAAAEAAAKTGQGDARKNSDMERRLEMALDELRETKRANTELESKLVKARSSGGGGKGAAPPATGLDWEAQKQRLLASLEEDRSMDEGSVAERNTIEGTILITDQVVVRKDEEIAELQRQLHDLGGNSAESRLAAASEILYHDEVIRQEREKLQQAQEEYRKRIGKAETDISLERAKLARERAELAERLQQLEQRTETRGSPNDSAENKPNRGRWLTRLGLKDIDESA
jgi:DNA repair exonuclease SbcCD ATPase subunit